MGSARLAVGDGVSPSRTFKIASDSALTVPNARAGRSLRRDAATNTRDACGTQALKFQRSYSSATTFNRAQAFHRLRPRQVQRRQRRITEVPLEQHARSVQTLHDLQRGRLFVSAEARRIRAKLQVRSSDPKPRTSFSTAGNFRINLCSSADHETADRSRVLGQLIALDNFEDFQRHSATERITAEGRRVATRRQDLRIFFAVPRKRRCGNPPPSAFRHRYRVGQKRPRRRTSLRERAASREIYPVRKWPAWTSSRSSSSPRSSHSFRRPSRYSGVASGNAAFALDRFEQDRSGLRSDRSPHHLQIVKRYLPKTGDHRLETLSSLFPDPVAAIPASVRPWKEPSVVMIS